MHTETQRHSKWGCRVHKGTVFTIFVGGILDVSMCVRIKTFGQQHKVYVCGFSNIDNRI